MAKLPCDLVHGSMKRLEKEISERFKIAGIEVIECSNHALGLCIRKSLIHVVKTASVCGHRQLKQDCWRRCRNGRDLRFIERKGYCTSGWWEKAAMVSKSISRVCSDDSESHRTQGIIRWWQKVICSSDRIWKHLVTPKWRGSAQCGG